ncbi:hypothetical protein GQ43DRAFT_312927 [Delitschia confertaspora ATCC 74209]|uniref:Nucleotide-diphospho-sugar transferase domain-containing protein n=1 Tax=Delitschia confertaspora ATCC 74209 TaxID=1513339 RepID=A0A9P4JMV6_9PLEO|nr:hypothetical protein GQ43DRAFT_312927 [Delitschia confertaspora ATCC 74209]
MQAIALQGPWRRILLITLIPMVCLIVYVAHESALLPAGFTPLPYNRNRPEPVDEDPTMDSVVKALFQGIIHPVDYANFTDEDGAVYNLSGEPRFREKLGKKVLILDIDSRPLSNEGEIMHENLQWKGLRPLSAGMMSHYMYAMIHGYDYKFIRAPDYEDRWGTWVKVPVMKEALKTHDYIVFMDSDVVFHYPHLPIEWLMNYWNMTSETLAMMAIDPDEPQNYDAHRKIYLNTGFVVAQQSERTQEMFKAWGECPNAGRFKGCEKWKLAWAHEQAAFGEYLRYAFNRPEDIKVLPCTEANGAPEAVHRGGCKGIFVRHYWIDKGLVGRQFADSIMQYLLPRLHQSFQQPGADHIVNAKAEYKFDNADLVHLTEEEKAKLPEDGKGKNQKFEGW